MSNEDKAAKKAAKEADLRKEQAEYLENKEKGAAGSFAQSYIDAFDKHVASLLADYQSRLGYLTGQSESLAMGARYHDVMSKVKEAIRPPINEYLDLAIKLNKLQERADNAKETPTTITLTLKTLNKTTEITKEVNNVRELARALGEATREAQLKHSPILSLAKSGLDDLQAARGRLKKIWDDLRKRAKATFEREAAVAVKEGHKHLSATEPTSVPVGAPVGNKGDLLPKHLLEAEADAVKRRLGYSK